MYNQENYKIIYVYRYINMNDVINNILIYTFISNKMFISFGQSAISIIIEFWINHISTIFLGISVIITIMIDYCC